MSSMWDCTRNEIFRVINPIRTSSCFWPCREEGDVHTNEALVERRKFPTTKYGGYRIIF